MSAAQLNLKKEKQEQERISKADEELNVKDCPLPEEDFGNWLKFQKSNWRKIRKNFNQDKKVTSN